MLPVGFLLDSWGLTDGLFLRTSKHNATFAQSGCAQIAQVVSSHTRAISIFPNQTAILVAAVGLVAYAETKHAPDAELGGAVHLQLPIWQNQTSSSRELVDLINNRGWLPPPAFTSSACWTTPSD